MAVTASTVNTTDTLETLRVQFNNLNSDVVTLDSTVSGSGSLVPADNITTGDAAVSIATTSGNITIDAQASDADILFKGTDDASDITALQLDMSDAGKAIFNGAISATTITLSADGGVIVPDDGNIGSASSTAAMQISSGGIVTFADDIKIKDGGTIGVASAATAITIASTGIVTFVDDIKIKDVGTIGSATTADAITIAANGNISLSQNFSLVDDKEIVLGTNSDISIKYDETTTDSLVISSDVNDAALGIVYQADDGADAGDEWKMNFANGGVFTFGNDIASAGTHTALLTITPNATAASTTHAFVGVLSSTASMSSPAISSDAFGIPITLNSTDGSANAGDNIVQEAGSDENDRMLYEDATLDDVATLSSHGITFPGNRIQVAASSSDITTLTDQAIITPDFGASANFAVTLTDNRTLANPVNLVAGQSGSIFVTQDGTGSRTLSFGAKFHFVGGTAPTMTTTASAVDRVDYIVKSTDVIHAVVSLDVKATS